MSGGRTLEVWVSKAAGVMRPETSSLCARTCVLRRCARTYVCMRRSHGAALI